MTFIRSLLLVCGIAFAAQVAAQGSGETFESVRALAMKGDYQAQRNLAFGYTSLPYQGQDKSALLGCAWRTVIIHSGNARVDETDVLNYKVYCGPLDGVQSTAASAQARTLFKQIYRTTAPF